MNGMFLMHLDAYEKIHCCVACRGHHLGLDHAGMVVDGEWDEYADPISAMGNSDVGACYNAPHAHLLQWIQPQVVTKAMLPQGRMVPFTLNGSTRGGPANGQPGRVGLMIRSWVDSA